MDRIEVLVLVNDEMAQLGVDLRRDLGAFQLLDGPVSPTAIGQQPVALHDPVGLRLPLRSDGFHHWPIPTVDEDEASGLLPEVQPPQRRCPSNRGMLKVPPDELVGAMDSLYRRYRRRFEG